VKLLALVGVAGAAALALLAGPAGATNECRGFQVCAPVAGPWVVVPTSATVPRPAAQYLLTCPKGFIVGGLDAELTDRGIDVSFEALLGSPVNPGITTRNTALFTGRSVAGPVRPASFRPHIGCIPAAGGGGRIPTVVHIVPPGHPSVRHAWTVRVRPGTQSVRKTCAAGETLVAASHAVGFYGNSPPSAALIASVHATRSVHAGRVTVSIRAGSAVSKARAVVQILLTCAGGT
jgi:hypothetical protein